MSWKNTKQISFADTLAVEHDALKELDEVQSLIDWSRIEKLLCDVHTAKKGERIGHR